MAEEAAGLDVLERTRRIAAAGGKRDADAVARSGRADVGAANPGKSTTSRSGVRRHRSLD